MAVRVNPLTFKVRVVEFPGDEHPRLVVVAPATDLVAERPASERDTSIAATTVARPRTPHRDFIPRPLVDHHGGTA
jgi:hypothetical protein